jgi:chorismate synthase
MKDALLYIPWLNAASDAEASPVKLYSEQRMSSLFGTLFRVMTFGESHGKAVGCVIDGCPAGVPLKMDELAGFLAKRKPGQNAFTSPRSEKDLPKVLSGVNQSNVTLGSPICIIVENTDQRSQDYEEMSQVFRPSHADFSTYAKYGIREVSGGGRASARETIGRVAAASIAKQFLAALMPSIEVVAWVQRIHNVEASVNENTVSEKLVENSPIRCPDESASQTMQNLILEAKNQGNTLGGLVKCIVRGVPLGLGEPVFDKLEADLAKAILSLPATKSFEIGSGLSGTYLKGSEHNDPFAIDPQGQVKTMTNHSGGVQGGISNGMNIVIKAGFKPVSTLFIPQQTISLNPNDVLSEVEFKPSAGRHDSCVLPRAVPMVEAMVWLVLADHVLRQRALTGQPLSMDTNT